MAVDPLSAGSTVVDLAPAPVLELLPLAAYAARTCLAWALDGLRVDPLSGGAAA
jgi:hypothetical protein